MKRSYSDWNFEHYNAFFANKMGYGLTYTFRSTREGGSVDIVGGFWNQTSVFFLFFFFSVQSTVLQYTMKLNSHSVLDNQAIQAFGKNI